MSKTYFECECGELATSNSTDPPIACECGNANYHVVKPYYYQKKKGQAKLTGGKPGRRKKSKKEKAQPKEITPSNPPLLFDTEMFNDEMPPDFELLEGVDVTDENEAQTNLDEVKANPKKVAFYNNLVAAGVKKDKLIFLVKVFFGHAESDEVEAAKWFFKKMHEYKVEYLDMKAFLELQFLLTPRDIGITMKNGKLCEIKGEGGVKEIDDDEEEVVDPEDREIKRLEKELSMVEKDMERERHALSLRKSIADLKGIPYNPSTPSMSMGGVPVAGGQAMAVPIAPPPDAKIELEIIVGWKPDGSAEKVKYTAPLIQYEKDRRENPMMFQHASRPSNLGEIKPPPIDPVAYMDKGFSLFTAGRETGFTEGGGGASVISADELAKRENLNFEKGKLMGEMEKQKDITALEKDKNDKLLTLEKEKFNAQLEAEKAKKASGDKSEAVMIHEENMKLLGAKVETQTETLKTEMHALRSVLDSHGKRMEAVTGLVSKVGERVIRRMDEDDMEEVEEEPPAQQPPVEQPPPQQRAPPPTYQVQQPPPIRAAPPLVPRSGVKPVTQQPAPQPPPPAEPRDEAFFGEPDQEGSE